MKTVIKVENISKIYDLGELGSGSISKDLNSWYAKMLGRENPNSQVDILKNTTNGNKRDKHIALSNVSFEVKEGDVLGIIGKNGAGKSTLLKILSRVTSPSSGQFKVRGRIASLLEVGTGFHPELTGRENVFLNGAILGMTRTEIRSKFDEIVDFSGVGKFIDTPVKRYSSGMYVRLAFAVAAHLEPEILIVDEVLAVGDMEFQKKCLGKMKDVSEQGRTVLFVSHNMNAMQQLCNSGILITKGTITQQGDINSVINSYIESSKQDALLNEDFSRRGNKSILFKDFYVSNINGERIANIQMGEDVFLNISYQRNVDVSSIDISFTIKNSLGEAITHVQNMDSDFEIPKEQTFCDLNVKLENVLLVPGSYFISIWAGTNTEAYDCIENCMHFEVHNNPDFNRFVYPHNIKTFIKSSWRKVV